VLRVSKSPGVPAGAPLYPAYSAYLSRIQK
jgi:hypothetical protein